MPSMSMTFGVSVEVADDEEKTATVRYFGNIMRVLSLKGCREQFGIPLSEELRGVFEFEMKQPEENGSWW
jgi:hypothetical protein